MYLRAAYMGILVMPSKPKPNWPNMLNVQYAICSTYVAIHHLILPSLSNRLSTLLIFVHIITHAYNSRRNLVESVFEVCLFKVTVTTTGQTSPAKRNLKKYFFGNFQQISSKISESKKLPLKSIDLLFSL